MLFCWHPSLETGDDGIDSQHRHLFELTNELARSLETGGRLPGIPALVAELEDYAATHFADEEVLIARSPLPERERRRHLAAHRQFIVDVQRLAAQSLTADGETIHRFLDFLAGWLVMHILKMDRRLAASLHGRRAVGSAPTTEQLLLSALAEAERRFRLISEGAPTMIWICGPSGGRDYANRAWFDYVGLPAGAASAVDWLALVHPDDRDRYAAAIADGLAAGAAGEVELRVRTAGGQWGWILERYLPRMQGSTCVGLVAAASDISAIKRSEAMLAEANQLLEREVALRTRQLEAMALTDPLTGLANRRQVFNRLDNEVEQARRLHGELAVLFFDVDHFKVVNDTFGHARGDRVLVAVAQMLRRQLGTAGLVGRIGGEEFVALLAGVGVAKATALAERLRAAVEETRFDGDTGPITVSVGVAVFRPGLTAETLVNLADDALLSAKRAGRNRVRAAGGGVALPSS